MDRQPQSTTPIKIILVDDHGVVREGVTLILERTSHMKVVATAADGKEGVAAALLHEPDVVVMDLVLPALSGVDATQRIITALPHTRVVILTCCDTSEHVFKALRAGARGYVLKDCAGAELVRAVTTVMAGDRYLSPQLTGALIDGLLSDSIVKSPLESLSAREREVLHLTVAGSSSAQIAQRLCLSRKTVDTYRSRVMLKLGVPDLARLIHFAVEHAMTPVHGMPTMGST
jgi:DNA-binding NarL/FixJ family response regulator